MNPGQIVGQHLDLACRNRVEGLLGDRLRAFSRHIDPSGHVGVNEASVHASAACASLFRPVHDPVTRRNSATYPAEPFEGRN